VNSPPPKPEVILTNFFAEPTVLLVPITSREIINLIFRLRAMTMYLRLNLLIFLSDDVRVILAVTLRVLLVEHELLSLQEHLSSSPGISGFMLVNL
jgi:ABC-type transporter Mla maintaining outer membrane lipid asymmetry ATPase subunit MlaF